MPRAHVVVVPYLFSGNVNAALQLAKLLHRHGVYTSPSSAPRTIAQTAATPAAACRPPAPCVAGRDGFCMLRGHPGQPLRRRPRHVRRLGAQPACVRHDQPPAPRRAAPQRDLARLNGTPRMPQVTCVRGRSPRG
ncbi:hypothetical protein ACP4OV_005433 [Aristida adscensionis]